MADDTTTEEAGVQSLEVAEGDTFGDLLSADRIETGKKLKIGLLATGVFEYWSMYPKLNGLLEQDARVVRNRLASSHDIVDPGLVDTMDKADAAGRRAAQVAVALRRVVERFRLDGVALLCQHFIEKQLKTTPNLALAELHRTGFPGVGEGDLIGVIMMKVLHQLSRPQAPLHSEDGTAVDWQGTKLLF